MARLFEQNIDPEAAVLMWVDHHLDDIVFQKKILFWTVTVRIRDIANIFFKMLDNDNLDPLVLK